MRVGEDAMEPSTPPRTLRTVPRLSPPPQSALSDEIAAFLRQGVSLLVGTCDASGAPECMRAVGAEVQPDRRHLVIYLPEATSRETRIKLLGHPRIAVLASYPLDHRSLQLKGSVKRLSVADDAALGSIQRYLETFAGVLEGVGMPSDVVHSLSHWPAFAVELEVEELFVQTPGPGAGARLAGSL